ncbi:NnrU family protein [Sulfitobacter mediterraneus]|uniref:NnrU family protein n=1 Tax=Sulfitobacter mediterraneus TaxID=83219 RepID=UPI0019339F5B|nr:NnrU family protein [Sulfitobacter mediterraneus]MBM1311437.1 NnrU family protein [Sulfitobacter mediterraneus]MBM1315319.1 NnrU family protein [Sulfitobacter mediterraneus]MBM1323680.1 NnrU family protein [Sulfitobacter mediterraneus]MBM1327592.1 NnrU family protein [Sulfitobacter mediterraneus]MBM1398940.1 NnrU family protein [Sulfitobacter mediterraneus]
MILLFLGLALWTAAHFYKRALPAQRAALGEKGKGFVALAIGLSILLMIFGYRMWDGTFFWGRTSALTGINNLLMVAALYFVSPGPSKGAIFYKMRHPMLTGFSLWALAHLLVNGDTPSLVLFGGLLVWALAEMVVINRAEPSWTPPQKGSIAKDAMFLVISLVLLAVIGLVHSWLGYNPFG